ncbi:hypothetical protein [Verrucosispora sp. WMMD573]|uniref:hypothetical protein n=1 Tax=Verrucosispora sp. WMMD573 TaxID=3015149 RepID=UPI00248AB83B|nr:hypothetical protein [Verrucosispora sp. WMMD573]WBB55574.1 hypothetical protein O7601_05540 [Verrucosispora sp. WMMD573]
MCIGVLLASSVAACDDPPPDAAPTVPAPVSPAPAATSAGWTAPPLRLPTVGPGDACPVAEPRPWSDSDRAHRVLGPGPLYPVADYFVTTVDGPGCYAYQVDGKTFSVTIVFRAVPAGPS